MVDICGHPQSSVYSVSWVPAFELEEAAEYDEKCPSCVMLLAGFFQGH